MTARSRATLDPQMVRQQANAWYHRQRDLAAKCLGTSWPQHQTWVEDYIKSELRERLAAIGWVKR